MTFERKDGVGGGINEGQPNTGPTLSNLTVPLLPRSDRSEAFSTHLENLCPSVVHQFFLEAKQEGNEFLTRTGFQLVTKATESSLISIPMEQWKSFDRWYENVGRTQSEQLSSALTAFIERVDIQGHPAHDRRHILIMDPLFGLQRIQSCIEGSQGVGSLFLLPCLFHDLGRLLEPALGRIEKDEDLESKVATDHAYISFKLMRDFFYNAEHHGLPVELQDHLLFAVLAHPMGDYPTHSFTHLTQSCDRAQIYGVEGFRRMMSDIGVKDHKIFPSTNNPGFPNEPKSYGGEDKNLLGHIEYFIRKGNPFPGREELLPVTSRILWLMVRGTEFEGRFFDPELSRARGSEPKGAENPLPEALWGAVIGQPTEKVTESVEALRIRFNGSTLEEVVFSFLEAPATASLKDSKSLPPNQEQGVHQTLCQIIHGVPEGVRLNFREAILFAMAVEESAPTIRVEEFLTHKEPIVRATAKIIMSAMEGKR